ncbi:helix-turn-helix domain-containing protein [Pararhodospirillum photometricum]|uniref:helix-turn-helix domain-containing protein n=1 Tax=Pararhodospirillum photometricum TaxID=1084 RepID=UPI0005A148E0|nr:helix-turn-helix transcriptional regulator [Pararhodospirillum photometricum]
MPTPGPFRLALAVRLREVETRLGSQARVCEVAGVGRSTWARWVAGESDPGFEALSRLAVAAKVSLDWLATGSDQQGGGGSCPKNGTDPSPSPPTLDEAFLAHVADGIASVYAEEAARLSPRDLGRLSGRLVNDLVGTYSDPVEREVGLRVLLTRLRQDLRAAPDSPEARKHSA